MTKYRLFNFCVGYGMYKYRLFNFCVGYGMYKYRLFNFCVGYGMYTSSRDFITNTKHCITYLALTQLFPVLVTSWFHSLIYTCVAFCCIYLGVCHFFLPASL